MNESLKRSKHKFLTDFLCASSLYVRVAKTSVCVCLRDKENAASVCLCVCGCAEVPRLASGLGSPTANVIQSAEEGCAFEELGQWRLKEQQQPGCTVCLCQIA